MSKKRNQESAEMNMTPMIDVVFQMIIFFVVTLKMTKEENPDIDLENGRNGETITSENMPIQTLTIEVDRRTVVRPHGRISINNATLSLAQLDAILKKRYAKFGSFPVLIRADKDAVHEDVRKVMDRCTANGVWKVGFVAVQEAKDKSKKRRP